jgi:dinuclear metal center YbgI/SA1388 family protein
VAKLEKLLESFEGFWPAAHAEDWDRVGPIVGSRSAEISKILVSVDLTDEVFEEATLIGAQLILTHHPFLLKGIESVAEETLKGQLLTKLIRAGVSLFSAHTNADVQADGASSLMAQSFGLVDLKPIVPSNGGFGHGVIGRLPNPIDLESFAKKVAHALPATARNVVFSGEATRLITNVAVCSGAGDSFLPQVLASEADVYVTSDLRHHPSQDAISTPRNGGPLSLVDVSHWAAESLWLTGALEKLNSIAGIHAVASTLNTDPWTQEVERF